MTMQRKSAIISLVFAVCNLTFSVSAWSASLDGNTPPVWSSQDRQIHTFNAPPRERTSDLVWALDSRSSRDILICEPQVSNPHWRGVMPPQELVERWMNPDANGFTGAVAESEFSEPQ